MTALTSRIDAATITVTFLPLPRGKKRGAGIGFCGPDPVGSVDGPSSSSPPLRWVSGKPEAITFQDVKKLFVNGGSADQAVGWWYAPKGDERAVVWTRDGDGTLAGGDLHPAKWDKSSAMACGGGQQAGFGYEKFAKQPTRGLLWSGTRESLVVLTGPDAESEAYCYGVSDGVQVGRVGRHACLWRGSAASWTELHPSSSGIVGSECTAVGDGQQVGIVWGEEQLAQAALWSGTSASFVSLAPAGYVQSRPRACARGFQVGHVSQTERGMKVHAALWGGSAADFIDLQQFLPEPWNASVACGLHVEGTRLRIIGYAQQAVQSGGYEVDAAKLPVIWEVTLRQAEAPAPSPASSAPVRAVASASAGVSEEQQIESLGNDFARAIIAADWSAAGALVAPWLQELFSGEALAAFVGREKLADVPLVDFVLTGNEATLEHLKDSDIDAAVTAATFRQWMSLEFTPDPDNDAGLDYCLKLWLVVADLDGRLVIAHVEPGD